MKIDINLFLSLINIFNSFIPSSNNSLKISFAQCIQWLTCVGNFFKVHNGIFVSVGSGKSFKQIVLPG